MDFKYRDAWDNVYRAKHKKTHDDAEQHANIDKTANKIAEWIWEEAKLVKDEMWYGEMNSRGLRFDEVSTKILQLIIEERN